MKSDKLVSVENLQSVLAEFSAKRNWDKFHTPRNLLLALVGEVGELSEIFQWLTEKEIDDHFKDSRQREHLKEEMADVFIYLVRLAQIMKIDLNDAVADKLIKNAIKYPESIIVDKL